MAAVVTVYEVRRALRASSIETSDCRYEGRKRRCAEVGRYMMRCGISTQTIAEFRHGKAQRGR